MVSFQKIYEWVFKSFRIKGSVSLVKVFEQEEVKHLMIIRRSWIYGIFINLLLPFIVATTVANVLYVLENFATDPVIGYSIVGLIVFSIALTVYSGLAHLLYFHKIHGKQNSIIDIYEWEQVLNEGGAIFARFFNRVTMSYFLYIIVTLFVIGHLVLVSGDYSNSVPYLTISSLCVQVILIAYYRWRMIDLEMDYILVIPGKIYFIDQVGVHANIQTLQLIRNIKIIQSRYPNFLGSFFNFWTIEIILDTMAPGMQNVSRPPHMHYVSSPLDTVNNMNKLLLDYEQTPLVMDTILTGIGRTHRDLDEPDTRRRIGQYLIQHEEHMKRLFLSGTPHERNEILRIYKKYMPHHAGF